MKRLKRVVSALLILTLLMQIVPLNIFAIGTSAEALVEEPIDAETGEKSTVETTDQELDIQDNEVKEKTPVYILYEEESLRQDAEKHFRLSDGSFLAVGYGGDVHYQDEQGNWQEIDNTLSLTEIKDSSVAASTSQQVYESINGAQTRRFASELDDSGYLFTAASGEYSISISAVKQPLEQESAEERAATSAIVAEVCNPEDKRDAISEDERRQLPLEKQTEPGKLGATVRYTNVWESTDLVYRSEGYDVKESIVISTPMNRYDYQFRISLRGLKPELENDGSISLKQPDGSEVFMIPAPYMEDASGEYSDSVKYVLNSTGDDYYLTVSADAEWINDASRSWPIIIDPTVEYNNSTSTKYLLTSYVSSSTPYQAPSDSSTRIKSGYTSTTGKTVGLIYVNKLPSVPTGSTINEAYIELTRNTHTGATGNAHRLFATTLDVPVPSPLGQYPQNVTWNHYYYYIEDKYASLGTDSTATILDYNWETGSNPYEQPKYYITSALQEWKGLNGPTISRLLVLDNRQTSTTESQIVYYGSSFSTSGSRPTLYVTYRDATGLEPIYGYHTQNIGRAGTGYINNYTLHTTLSVPLISRPSEALPFQLNLIYNENQSNVQADSRAKMGYGWKLSVQQSIQTTSEQNERIYEDGDGTRHTFIQSGINTYLDEDGLGFCLVQNSGDENYTMTDQNGNTWYFSGGYIYKFTTSEGNAFYYVYEGKTYTYNGSAWKPTATNHRLTQIRRQNHGASTSQVLVNLGYEDESVEHDWSIAHLSTITDAAGRVISLDYTDDMLTKISFPDTQTAIYGYSPTENINNIINYLPYYRLTDATDNEAGYRISYQYWGNTLNVMTFAEKTRTVDSNNEEDWKTGQRTNCFLSEASYARFRYFKPDNPESTNQNLDGYLVTRHYFDNYGRTINIIALDPDEKEVYGSSCGAYTEQDGTSAKNNRLTVAASAGTQSMNLLSDSGFEHQASDEEWSDSGSESVSYVPSHNITYKPRTGNAMAKMKRGEGSAPIEVYQSVNLEYGKTYVLSAYVCVPAEMTGGSVHLEFRQSNEAPRCSAAIQYATGSIESGWERLEVAFSPVFCQNGNASYEIAAVAEGSFGVVLIDDFQLEEVPSYLAESNPNQNTASSLNLLQFGSFECLSASNPSPFSWWERNAASYAELDFFQDGYGQRIALKPGIGNKTRVAQEVPINAPAGKTYLLSAWGLTPRTNLDNGKTLIGDNSSGARFFGVIAKLEYQDNAYSPEYFYLSFNGNISQWQYASTVIVPKQAAEHPEAIVSKITVSAALDYCANRSYIDNISLTVEPVQTYDYDDNGNLIAANNSEGKTATEYDEANRLTKYTNLAGVEYTLNYSYDDRNPSSIRYDGLSTSYTYDNAGNTTQTMVSGGGKHLTSTSTYDSSKNYKTSNTDENGVTVNYYYDNTSTNTGIVKGLLTRTETPKSTGSGTNSIYYFYNNLNDKLDYTAQTDIASLHYRYGEDGSLAYLIRRTFPSVGDTEHPTYQTYCFTYDEWGRQTKIEVAKSAWENDTPPTSNERLTLVTYSYNDDGNLKEMDYPNGDYVKYTYDVFDRLIREVYYNHRGQVKADYRYVYNADGILAKQYGVELDEDENEVVVEAYTFEYDSLGRLVRSKETGSGGSTVQRTEHLYDTANRLTGQSWVIGSKNYSESYTYNSSDGSLATMEAANGTKLYYTYDGLKRLQRVTTKSAAGTSLFYSQTEYKAGAETRQTTNQVSGYGYYNADDSIRYKNTYTYDNLGNIAQIKEVLPSGSTRVLAKYTYDNENQLTQEVRYSYTGNSLSGTQTTVTYTYDTAGNLLQSSDGTTAGTVSYTYGNSKWADLLTQYDGETIYYDDGGNPTNWYNGSFYSELTWTQGRRLSSLKKGNVNISYTYDMAGIRTSKTDYSDDVRHEYITQNGKVVRELVLEASTRDFLYCLDFFYDTAGRPYAMRKYTDAALTTYSTYHYLLNAQGDVMGLFHQSGTVKATYTYDAWGRVLTATGDLADVNPLRYRGYFWDSETGWYYLQSRYYDPIVKRFLNADIFYSTGQGFLGYNMFAYCENNPVCRADTTGHASSLTEDTDGDGIPDYLMIRWRTLTLTTLYRMNANCYAFGFQLEVDPRTGKPFRNKPQPGEFSGQSCTSALSSIFNAVLSGENISLSTVRDVIINAAKEDGKKLGFDISEVSSADYATEEGQWVVALGYGIHADGYDYHWWRRMDDGIWFHKPGASAVQAYDSSGNIINDPGTCNRGYYQYFLGYYVVTPAN